MDSSSFIPKRAITAKVDRPTYQPVSLFSVIGVAVLLVSGGAWAIARFYAGVLDNQINRPCEEVSLGGDTSSRGCGLLASVDLEEKNLDRATIVLLQRLDSKFKIARELMVTHNTTEPLFKILEALTLPSVSYNHFSFTASGVELTGLASSYEDIAIQSQIFTAERSVISSFIFSNLDLDSTGRVVFKLNLVLDPELTNYAKQAGQAQTLTPSQP
jgi:hypothetical protein